MPRPRPGVGGNVVRGARRDRMWGRLLERSKCRGPFGEGVGVAPPPVPRKAGSAVLLHVRRGAVQTQAYASEAASPSATGPGEGGRIAAAARPMRPRRDACSSRRPSRARRVQRVRQRTSARQPPAPPPRVAQRRQAGPPEPRLPAVRLAPGEHRRAPRSRIRAWRRPGVSTSLPSPCGALLRIGERRVGPGAAIRVQRATEHHR